MLSSFSALQHEVIVELSDVQVDISAKKCANANIWPRVDVTDAKRELKYR